MVPAGRRNVAFEKYIAGFGCITPVSLPTGHLVVALLAPVGGVTMCFLLGGFGRLVPGHGGIGKGLDASRVRNLQDGCGSWARFARFYEEFTGCSEASFLVLSASRRVVV